MNIDRIVYQIKRYYFIMYTTYAIASIFFVENSKIDINFFLFGICKQKKHCNWQCSDIEIKQHEALCLL